MNKKAIITDIVIELLARTENNPHIDDDSPLITSGRLDSLRVLELATRLEQAFGISIAERGFDQYDFDSVTSIYSYLGTI